VILNGPTARYLRQPLPWHMDMGSIAFPGAAVMVNNDLSASVQNRLQIQLYIDETITGEELDMRIAADPSYVKNIRALRQRLLVMRDFRETTNRSEMDVVIFVRESMVYLEKNCFGPTGQAFALTNIYWGQLGIFDTNLHRSCKGESCGCHEHHEEPCGCSSIPIGSLGCDGYGRSPYYPARFDPEFPKENHWYNQINRATSVFGGYACGQSPDRLLAKQYWCDAHGNVIPQIDCRLVKQ